MRPEQWAATVLRQAGKHWDELLSEVSASAVDAARVRAFIRAAKSLPQARIPPEITEDTPVESVLTTLKLTVEGRLTNAGVLLFVADPQRVWSQARVRIARIRSTDDLAPLPDVSGTVLDQIENAIRLVNDYNPTRYAFEEPPPGEPALRRREHPKYASFAIREALVNALVHRDYAAPGDVQVRVYDDRIEVWNPGELASGLTPESLKQRGHPSIRRNPSIGLVTWMTGFFDTWGTGTLRMVEQSRRLGLPDPVFKTEVGGFRVMLLADALSEDVLRERGLSEREIAGVLIAKQNRRITSADYQRAAEVGHTVAAEDLAHLVDRGVLVRHGAGRGVFYTIVGQLAREAPASQE